MDGENVVVVGPPGGGSIPQEDIDKAHRNVARMREIQMSGGGPDPNAWRYAPYKPSGVSIKVPPIASTIINALPNGLNPYFEKSFKLFPDLIYMGLPPAFLKGNGFIRGTILKCCFGDGKTGKMFKGEIGATVTGAIGVSISNINDLKKYGDENAKNNKDDLNNPHFGKFGHSGSNQMPKCETKFDLTFKLNAEGMLSIGFGMFSMGVQARWPLAECNSKKGCEINVSSEGATGRVVVGGGTAAYVGVSGTGTASASIVLDTK
jgi:hypothetical protein